MYIVNEARTWLGVKFRWQGRVKQGVDCLGLVICVGDAIGYKYNGKLVSSYDIPYSPASDFKIIKDYFSEFYNKKSTPDIGNIILQKLSKNQFHLGVYSGETIIHASIKNKCVVENNFKPDFNCEFYEFNISK